MYFLRETINKYILAGIVSGVKIFLWDCMCERKAAKNEVK